MLVHPVRWLWGLGGFLAGLTCMHFASFGRASGNYDSTVSVRAPMLVGSAAGELPLDHRVADSPGVDGSEQITSPTEGLARSAPAEYERIDEDPQAPTTPAHPWSGQIPMLEEGVKLLRTAHPGDRCQRVGMALTTSVAAALEFGHHPCEIYTPSDPRGRFLEKLKREERPQFFFHNGKNYYFRRGLFPEYDEWCAGFLNGNFSRSKDPRSGPDTGNSMGADLEAAIELRILEAIALLGG